MKLQSLEIENFRNFEKKKLLFKESTTVIYGENSTGKSNILSAIDLIFSNMLYKAAGADSKLLKKFSDSDVKYNKMATSLIGDLRIEEEYFKVNYNYALKRKRINTININKISIATESFKLKYLADNDENMPIYVNYNLENLNTKINIGNKIKSFNKVSALDNNGSENFFPWIKWCFKYNNKDCLEKVKELIYNHNGEIKDISFENDGKKINIEIRNEKVGFNQLSYSEKIQFVLIGDIGRRLYLANPSIRNPFLGVGVVVIDDIDVVLDKYWQSYYLKNLVTIFPKIQFIIGTHNKQILKNCKEKTNFIEIS